MIFGIGFWIWLAGIIVLSVLPKTPVINAESMNPLISFGYLQHFVCYFIWTTLFFIWRMNDVNKIKAKDLMVFIGGAVFLALSGEVVQEFIVGRNFNMNDFWSNLIGVFSGILLYFIIFYSMVLFKRQNKA